MRKLERVLHDLAEMCTSARTARRVLPTLGSTEPSKAYTLARHGRTAHA